MARASRGAAARTRGRFRLEGAGTIALACAAAVVAVGCGGSDLELCGQIPGNGCPIGRGGTCDDESCDALYDCVDGSWTRVETCPTNADGGRGGSGGAAAGGAGAGTATGGCEEVLLDHTGETQGCQPDLQEPDCPAVAAEVCQPCMTGCVDFFMCRSVGWVDVAYCTEEGELIVFSP